ncbi:hypothetical protein DRW07_12915 [Alteromonas sediminis]|uniref:Uncharacterized protein n=1 Tax=Alteromonas sediminis TaxID=2259342 RepID=A0A3N5XZ01_9ALTE|nr:ATP-grasp fold amidoligase family protein [Alteromonas sediminis]RPJ65713.1 hypothetical protein DRW07_12915 [Alteromonas sediminis]
MQSFISSFLFALSNRLRYLKSSLLFKVRFYKYHGYFPDLKNPQTFSEKLCYRKFKGDAVEFSNIADKFAVRDYVTRIVGENYLIPLLGAYDFIDSRIWENLPSSFVLKTSHGSGERHVHIVRDKKSANDIEVINQINESLKEDFGLVSLQPFYSVKKRLVLIEELIGHGDIDDFKFHCFQDEVFIQVDIDRHVGHKRALYDRNWNRLDFHLGTCTRAEVGVPKPKNLEEMLTIAKKLANSMAYIRVDLYNVDGKIYFGEMTIAHGNGMSPFTPTEMDMEWGRLWRN